MNTIGIAYLIPETPNSFPRYMMATTATWTNKLTGKVVDVSENKPDICHVEREDTNDFVGMWIYGRGMVDVRFPKATTRPLTEEELDDFDGKIVGVNARPEMQFRSSKEKEPEAKKRGWLFRLLDRICN